MEKVYELNGNNSIHIDNHIFLRDIGNFYLSKGSLIKVGRVRLISSKFWSR